MTLFEQIELEAVRAANLIAEQGYMDGGHNGPYFDKETSVRNTAHWLFTFSVLYERTGKDLFKEASDRAIKYLTSRDARPMGASFFIRTNPDKDFCNGLIGQAWVMEALVKASNVFSRPELYKIAEELYLQHDFDDELSIWKRLNVDGSYNSPDPTFNHQLWFAAASSMLTETPTAQKASLKFFDNIATRVRLYSDGVVHHVSPVTKISLKIRKPPKVIEGFVRYGYFMVSKGKLRKKAAGYHAFNLYAFAMIKEQFPDHPFWKSSKFKKMLSAVERSGFLKEQENNKYSYPYNPTGLELACVSEAFNPGAADRISFWLNKQIEFTGEPGQSIMTKGTADEATARARIYEATRLKGDYNISWQE